MKDIFSDKYWLQAHNDFKENRMFTNEAKEVTKVYLRKIVKEFLSAVLRSSELEELRVFVNEICIHYTSQELLILHHIQQKWNICLQKESISEIF